MDKKDKLYTDADNGTLIPDEDEEYERTLAEEERIRQQAVERAQQKYEEERERLRKQQQKARDASIAKDKLDLMKMKAGIAEEDEQIKEEHTPERKLTPKEKLVNFWYHDKIWICLGAFAVIVTAFLVYDTVTRVQPDMQIMLIADDGLDYYSAQLEDIFESVCEDKNGDGEVYVQVMNMPLDSAQYDQIHVANNSKFLANLQQGQIIMVITDSNTDEDIQQIFADDLPEKLPDNPYVDEKGLSLNFAFLARDIGFEKMPNDLYLRLRRPINTMDGTIEEMQDNYDEALEYFIKVADMLSERAELEDDKGLTTEPIKKEHQTEVVPKDDSKTSDKQ